MSDLRVRFAPSPTGYLHIGGARTALFNFLLARKEQGTFILRIEDTDVERSTQESTDAILQAMDWLGLDYDEGPFYQSERFDLYKQKVQQLLDEGKAYKCYCTADELDAKREQAIQRGDKPQYDETCRNAPERDDDSPYVVRFKSSSQGVTAFNDLIKGTITFNNQELDDMIIQRTDGTPTYNFVVVVDDAEMGLTIVVRGDDHVNNTPRQIQIYKALGYAVPEFAHVPMILGSDKKRLSKRHGATSVMAYRDMGYLPEALVNYLVRLGWSHGDEEIFSMEELIEKFSLEHVGKSAGVFNPEKLLWLNEHYIKTGDPQRLGSLLKDYLNKDGIIVGDDIDVSTVVESLQDRSKTMVEMAEKAKFYFVDELTYDEKAKNKFITSEQKEIFELLLEKLQDCEFSHDGVEAAFNSVLQQTGLKFGKVGQPTRVALSGGTSAPGIFEVMLVLGRERCIDRLKAALAIIG
ncbi:MAG: glutamate--tRNA ligase [Desulfobacteraceae bacterium 4572_35.1]|nr:MAG: glutamate--tRNA ligase [Desulfobacteraceae bacterium 4572_35.1]